MGWNFNMKYCKRLEDSAFAISSRRLFPHHDIYGKVDISHTRYGIYFATTVIRQIEYAFETGTKIGMYLANGDGFVPYEDLQSRLSELEDVLEHLQNHLKEEKA